MTHPCLDCGIDTSTETGIGEYYHVHESVWFEAFGSTYDDVLFEGLWAEHERIIMAGFLCVGCLESRIGRQLTAADFSGAPVNHPTLYRKSERFLQRIGWVRMTSYAQALQDEWVHSIIGDTGFFVDVGAYDGVEHSNTFALEQRGWTGVCIEPNADAFERMRGNRKCLLSGWAASDTDGFILFDGVVPGRGSAVPCRRLDTLLNAVNAPPVIDYLSIDVEGHEMEVLAGMDFDRWQVKLATIEHNLYRDGPAHRDAIRERMIGLGFVLVGADVVAPGYGPYEDWWIHDTALAL